MKMPKFEWERPGRPVTFWKQKDTKDAKKKKRIAIILAIPAAFASSTRQRAGVSLLEVLIATAMLFGAVVVLAELAQIGRRHAQSAGERVVAQQLCQQKLNEVLVGLLPATAVSGQVEEAPGWVFQIEVEPLRDFAELDDLARVRVTVEQDPESDESSRRRTRRSFQLTRWMRVQRP